MAETSRPEVVVHMMSSVDGRIVSRRWSTFEGTSDYETVHAALGGDAWMCGRVTMQGFTRGQPEDDRDSTPVPRTDHVAPGEHAGYAIALDFHGRLHWGVRNDIEGDHVVVALGENVPDAHLNALRGAGLSYLFCGSDQLDLALLMGKLHGQLGIRRVLVEGGGGINGAFLEAGFVDEISLLVAPAVDGGRGIAAVFDYDPLEGVEPAKHLKLTLRSCEPREGGIVWLRYGVDRVTPDT